MLITFWQCLFGPRLYKIYRDVTGNSTYQPKGIEKWTDNVLSVAGSMYSVGYYTSPFLCYYAFFYVKGWNILGERSFCQSCILSISCFMLTCFILRGLTRLCSPKYVEFVNALKRAKDDNDNMVEIRKYDFEFSRWPVTFKMKRTDFTTWYDVNPSNTCAVLHEMPWSQQKIMQVLAFVAVHTFGLRLLYPGSMGIMHWIFWHPLMQGRTLLVEGYNGQRTKLQACDGNCIDTMFVDNRNKTYIGHILVICCEGNTGFYEIGIMNTPIKACYSALGWNHPGFGGSTGIPCPRQEQNAINAVMEYAMNELGFKAKDIVMFGWSIGGYTASLAAQQYNVRGLVLDATFDDVLPLAENQMPTSWSLLVKEVVRSYMNLNVADIVTKYDGPVHIIRRTQDEILCLRPGQLSTNRANNLLIEVLKSRHPDAVEGINAMMLLRYVNMLESLRKQINLDDVEEGTRTVLKLIAKYSSDHRSSHCPPLSEERFIAIVNHMEEVF